MFWMALRHSGQLLLTSLPICGFSRLILAIRSSFSSALLVLIQAGYRIARRSGIGVGLALAGPPVGDGPPAVLSVDDTERMAGVRTGGKVLSKWVMASGLMARVMGPGSAFRFRPARGECWRRVRAQ